jgi:hypothetical protein
VLRAYAIGFLGAVAALMVAAAVWFAVFQPLDRPGLVWGGNVYESKKEFKLYLKSKSLSYSTWLKRNPGVAPWEPGTRVTSRQENRTWDWKRDMLLAVNGALLATFAAALLARTATVGRHRPNWSMAADGASRASPVLTGRTGQSRTLSGMSETAPVS